MVVHWYEASMLFNPLRRLSRASMSVLSFALDESFTSGQFGPRLGKLDLHRADGSSPPSIRTPALITATSRGIVPHLSQDHVALTKSIGWTQIHFESFLEQSPPVPTLQGGPHPLHTFLHHRPDQQIIALSVRDPHDGREITANGKDFVSVRCVRGVRKMTPTAWRSYVLSCNPDVVTALSDIPFTNSPQSQKRTIKTLERSTAWLADLLRPIDLDSTTSTHPLNVLVHMVGGTEDRARKAFSETLLEKLQGKEMEVASPLTTLDEGLRGYVFDLVPLRASILQEAKGNGTPEDTTARIQALMDVSLRPLPTSKLRVVHSAASPHEILRLIRDVGVDLFDARWAQHAATLGVALDFSFPVRDPALLQHSTCNGPIVDPDGEARAGAQLVLFDLRT
ncbi:hypothetical protein NM688_g1723 [Phlebia brevispora]|uniref:Uncharacterized protein n=1 Tax=Phlebia brevispora TaxID=194682 RepID=A0ACC1TAZ6_9APHY|nr:hypothetical protein NM688_g1723 [Phlebia brevispora]